MGKRAEHDVGFDVDGAIAELQGAAVAAGAVPHGTPIPESPGAIALRHVILHGVQVEPRCSHKPCRLGGLCFALFEVAQYKNEMEGAAAVVAAAEQAESMQRVLATSGKAYAQSLSALVKFGQKFHTQESTGGVPSVLHDHETICVRPKVAWLKFEALTKNLAPFGDSLRNLISNTELRQTSRRKRGTLLLTATYQHLKWGGFTYREIAVLVPDKLGRTGVVERVRKRCKAKEARSIFPHDG